ncbi:MAG: RNA polymerase sigma factor [Caulobacteraceae bacterium]
MTSRLSLSSAHDLELVALGAAGEQAAFGELARRHGSAVRGLVRRMGADAAGADDVAQDAFLVAFERISDFRGEGAFRAWVMKIAARHYARRWRREARNALIASAEAPDEGAAAFAADDRIDLEEAMRSLTEAERVCVCLCYGAGFSHAEAAGALNAPLGTVKSHVKRGVDKLKARLAPLGGRGIGSEASG